MNKKQKEILNKILSDRTSGSYEILLKLNKLILSEKNDKKFIYETIAKSKTKLSHFAAINDYFDKIENLLKKENLNDLHNYLTGIASSESLKFDIILKKISKKLLGANLILTISKSGTLINIFKMWHEKNKNLKLVICESRPSNEGKLMAKELLNAGIKVTMITDAMAGIFLPKIDAVLTGADAILKNGNVINKVGSMSLALLCKHFKKPFYVITTRSKYVKNNKLRINGDLPDPVWKFRHKNLTTTNILFEEVDKNLITEIITD